MSAESSPQTLQPTALVHEAWLRVGGDLQPEWVSRAQFFSAAAEAMRRILVDRARRRLALRHGGGWQRIDLDAFPSEFGLSNSSDRNNEMILSLHEALEHLAEQDAQSADLIKLRYFIGLSVSEAAEALGLPKRTAERHLSFARTWLKREMEHLLPT